MLTGCFLIRAPPAGWAPAGFAAAAGGAVSTASVTPAMALRSPRMKSIATAELTCARDMLSKRKETAA